MKTRLYPVRRPLSRRAWQNRRTDSRGPLGQPRPVRPSPRRLAGGPVLRLVTIGADVEQRRALRFDLEEVLPAAVAKAEPRPVIVSVKERHSFGWVEQRDACSR